MKVIDKIKELFGKTETKENENYEEVEKEIEESGHGFEHIYCDENMYIYYAKRSKKYVVIKDTEAEICLWDNGIEWVEMNKHVFDYYYECDDFIDLFRTITELREKEMFKKKTEEECLKDYLQHCTNYRKIIRNMKMFKINGEQYDKLIGKIKTEINRELSNTLNNFIDMNEDLTSTRSYKELIDNLQDIKEFEKKFPLYKRANFDDKVSHCGYPDYMWQAGVDRTYVVLKKIPYSNNSLFVYNEYIGGNLDEDYITKMMIVSKKEREIILDYWDEIQDENEYQFESDYIKSVIQKRTEQENQKEEENEGEM